MLYVDNVEFVLKFLYNFNINLKFKYWYLDILNKRINLVNELAKKNVAFNNTLCSSFWFDET